MEAAMCMVLLLAQLILLHLLLLKLVVSWHFFSQVLELFGHTNTHTHRTMATNSDEPSHWTHQGGTVWYHTIPSAQRVQSTEFFVTMIVGRAGIFPLPESFQNWREFTRPLH